MTSRTTRPARDAANDTHASPRHVRIAPSLFDEIAELWTDIRDNPVLAMVCTGGGFIVGMLAVVVPAVVVGLFQ